MKVQAVFGPPGTGKTRYLSHIAARMRERGMSGMFLSYTKAAALEAMSRVGNGDPGRVKPSTIHSLAFNMLGMTRSVVVDNAKLVEFGEETGFKFKTLKKDDEIQEGDEYLSALQFRNNRMCTDDEAYDQFGRPGTLDRWRLFLRDYGSWKREFGYMDFDDMLLRTLEADPPKADAIILDEAQDCSPLQWKVFNHLVAKAEHVFIAGDDDQAIYEWNGADPHGMVKFAEEHGAEVKILNQSHRIPLVVHQYAHGLINQVQRRKDKEYKPRDAAGTLMTYGDMVNYDVREFDERGGGMVLVRDRFRLEEWRRLMNRDMIPYHVLGGSSPWTNKIANELREGKNPQIPPAWKSFYAMADLNLPVNVILSTIHQAKGRESARVVVDLVMPARAQADLHLNRDAELRVWYVALTRASEELVLCGSNPLI